jgi:SAM-dependent methyltransferase
MQGVIEHLERPEQVAAELGRILPPGGYLYADVVFLSRYHQAPEDYQRLTRPGLARLFEALEVVETGMLCGPASTLCDDARHMLALLTSFGSPGLFRWGYHYPWAYLTWPIKFLDVWLERHPMADRTAYAYFVIARKPG